MTGYPLLAATATLFVLFAVGAFLNQSGEETPQV